jgi:hypothetical protein
VPDPWDLDPRHGADLSAELAVLTVEGEPFDRGVPVEVEPADPGTAARIERREVKNP